MLTLLAQIPLNDDRREIARDLRATAESAAAEGVNVYPLPPSITNYSADQLLSYLRVERGRALFSGYIPSEEQYLDLESALRRRGLSFLNSSEQTFTALRFQRFYPLVHDLTAESAVAFDAAEAAVAVEQLGLPLFVKRDIKSFKEAGWKACTIERAEQIADIRTDQFPVVLRKLLPLRRTGEHRNSFPVSREYRFYLFRGRVLGGGYYWSERDPFGELISAERDEVEQLASQVAARLPTPLLTVDLGQLEDGSWRLIEVGDVQFSGIAHMSKPLFWQQLLAGLAS